ncbi:MAG TPA: beta-ketoacyl-ACP reductase [Rhodospirillaceae bacterium]|nr:beta-ketoacyl-ACP reductase [Rhodospirillaceae bacterium]
MNQVAIVTGGTRGIGRAISKALIADGMKVAAVYHGNDEAAKSFREETGHETFKFDITDLDACMSGVAEIEKKLGPVTVLVNNAGITRDGVLHKMTADSWRSVIEANLYSCFNMCRAVINGMRERGYGRIINNSSINGQKGQFGQTNYCASKSGIIGFSRALAQESAAKGITVNVVCPGYIDTEMTAVMDPQILASVVKQIPVGRLGKPEEVAGIVSMLASEKASFITGATIAVNGGQHMA